MVVDTEKDAQNRANNYLVFIFGKDDNVSFDEEVEKEDSSRATTTVKRPYSHNSEVWRGRLNQLWFDKDRSILKAARWKGCFMSCLSVHNFQCATLIRSISNVCC